mmetsp:Transcript_2600/g.6240  ORF Transcript_2600/g.6240 Transcript_2600/m.6240 type:complete len:87 (-) Transcript_2600:142-402(-)
MLQFFEASCWPRTPKHSSSTASSSSSSSGQGRVLTQDSRLQQRLLACPDTNFYYPLWGVEFPWSSCGLMSAQVVTSTLDNLSLSCC